MPEFFNKVASLRPAIFKNNLFTELIRATTSVGLILCIVFHYQKNLDSNDKISYRGWMIIFFMEGSIGAVSNI